MPETVEIDREDCAKLLNLCEELRACVDDLGPFLKTDPLTCFLEELSRIVRAVHQQTSSLSHERERGKALRAGRSLVAAGKNGGEDLLRLALVRLIPHDTLPAFADEIDSFLEQKR